MSELSRTQKIAARTVAAGLATLLFSGCAESYDVKGTVYVGADGKTHIAPDNAERAVYKDKADCEADIAAHMDQIKKLSGAAVKASDICRPVSEYKSTDTAYPAYYYYGFIASRSGAWQSDRLVDWTPLNNGNFAGQGDTMQHNVVKAPSGAEEGQHASITEHTSGEEHAPSGGSVHENPPEEPVHISVPVE